LFVGLNWRPNKTYEQEICFFTKPDIVWKKFNGLFKDYEQEIIFYINNLFLKPLCLISYSGEDLNQRFGTKEAMHRRSVVDDLINPSPQRHGTYSRSSTSTRIATHGSPWSAGLLHAHRTAAAGPRPGKHICRQLVGRVAAAKQTARAVRLDDAITQAPARA
jgi:hypothetical protein